MPAPPNIDYVICPDGSTAIGDNCGGNVPLYIQEEIAYAKIKADPVFQAAVEAEQNSNLPKLYHGLLFEDDKPQAPVKKTIDTKTIVIVLGVGLLAYYLIKKNK